jgi:hypothetical protein
MLTLAKVEVYGRLKGDIDGFSRSGLDPKTAGMTDDDWWQIAKIRQALSIIESGSASPAFVASTEAEILAVTCDDETRAAIRELQE